MRDLISIIVPVYNCEKLLNRSLNAILNQYYTNIEIILINDGSTDGTGDICSEYALKDSRIRYFTQENHGQGYSRARGIALAKGEYIAFCDADDYMLPQMYGLMYRTMKHDNSDVVACQWNFELPDGRHTIDNRIYGDSFYGVKSGTEFAKYLYLFRYLEKDMNGYANGVVVSPWNKLYKKKTLYGFQTTGFLGEDEEMNDYVLSKPGVKVSVIREELYYWCDNPDSITHKPFSDKNWHVLSMLGKRQERYADAYIKEETRKLIFNLYIEYTLKSSIAPPKFARKLYTNVCIKLLPYFIMRPKCLFRMLAFGISTKLYKALLKAR